MNLRVPHPWFLRVGSYDLTSQPAALRSSPQTLRADLSSRRSPRPGRGVKSSPLSRFSIFQFLISKTYPGTPCIHW